MDRDFSQINDKVRRIENELNELRTGRSGSQIKSPLDADSQRIIQNIIIYPVTFFLPGTSAATAANYTHFFVADRGYLILSVLEVHGTAGSDAGAVTVQLEKISGTSAPGNGVSLLASAFNLKGVANTVQYGNLSSAGAFNTIVSGDRLALKKSGTLTAVDSVVVTIYLQKL